jgi:high-affinity nickel-transport protein
MDALPSDWNSLAAVVFLLGMRHGFDADHLATIDGLTRVGRHAGARHARWSGVLFSLGHGAVVLAIAAGTALLLGTAGRHWQVPGWLAASGAWTSIVVLGLLGVLNLRAVFAAAPDEVVAPVRLKSRLLGPLAEARSPAIVMLVGAAFALSFDTVSQAALFAATAAQYDGLRDALALGALFLLGMLVTDGVNGLWIARLIARADGLARVASRVMGLAVGSVSLLVAGLGAARLFTPTLVAWAEGREALLGATVVALVAASFVAARWLAGRTPAGTLAAPLR